jgi:ABC-type transporter Mla subunit MlaD
MLSIWLFGNKLPWGVVVGAGLVVFGGGVYSLPVRKQGGEGEKGKGVSGEGGEVKGVGREGEGKKEL